MSRKSVKYQALSTVGALGDFAVHDEKSKRPDDVAKPANRKRPASPPPASRSSSTETDAEDQKDYPVKYSAQGPVGAMGDAPTSNIQLSSVPSSSDPERSLPIPIVSILSKHPREASFRISALNVNQASGTHSVTGPSAFSALLHAIRPDVYVLTETTRNSAIFISRSNPSGYASSTHQISAGESITYLIRHSTFHVLSQPTTVACGTRKVVVLHGQSGFREFLIIAAHLKAQGKGDDAAQNQSELHAVEQIVRQCSRARPKATLVVIGDLNHPTPSFHLLNDIIVPINNSNSTMTSVTKNRPNDHICVSQSLKDWCDWRIYPGLADHLCVVADLDVSFPTSTFEGDFKHFVDNVSSSLASPANPLLLSSSQSPPLAFHPTTVHSLPQSQPSPSLASNPSGHSASQ